MSVVMDRWVTTGDFAAKGHVAGPPPEKRIHLTHKHFCEGLLVEGRPGGSKTICAVNPTIEAYAKGGGSLFIICIKKDAAREAVALCRRAGRGDDIIVVGDGDGERPYFITGGLSPATIADIALQVYRLNAPSSRGDAFFEANAEIRLENAAKIIYGIYGDGDGVDLRRFVVRGGGRDEIIRIAEDLAKELDGCGDAEKQARADAIIEALDYERGEYEELRKSDKTHASVMSCLTPFLSVFNDRKFARTFCDRTAGSSLDDLFRNKIVIVSLDVERSKRQARSTALMMMAQFEAFMRNAHAIPSNDPRSRVEIGFVLDEWGDIASSSQADFLRLARSARIGYTFAVQSDSELGRVLGGMEDAEALIGLFGSRVCFSTIDRRTMESFQHVLGKTEQTHLTAADVRGSSSGSNTGSSSNFGGGFGGSNSQGASSGTNTSRTLTKTTREADVCNQQTFRGLQRKDDENGKPAWSQAVAMLNLNGRAIDDVLWCEPVFAE